MSSLVYIVPNKHEGHLLDVTASIYEQDVVNTCMENSQGLSSLDGWISSSPHTTLAMIKGKKIETADQVYGVGSKNALWITHSRRI